MKQILTILMATIFIGSYAVDKVPFYVCVKKNTLHLFSSCCKTPPVKVQKKSSCCSSKAKEEKKTPSSELDTTNSEIKTICCSQQNDDVITFYLLSKDAQSQDVLHSQSLFFSSTDERPRFLASTLPNGNKGPPGESRLFGSAETPFYLLYSSFLC